MAFGMLAVLLPPTGVTPPTGVNSTAGPGLLEVLRRADQWRQGRLVSSEYDETTWSARNYMTFVAQRISVATHLSLAQEIAEALGLSVAADPRE